MKKIINLTLFMFAFCGVASAQQKVEVTAGADIVSAYIWRGTYNAGASFQPTLKAQYYGFSLGAWGSSDFIGEGRKEVDLSIGYSIKGLTLGITDYWWEGEGAFDYFKYTKGLTDHRWEGSITYQLPVEKFPLIISWNTMFAGNDYDTQGDRAFSTYLELNYPFTVGSVDMHAAVGATPWYSPSILPSENKGFSVCNVTIGAAKALKLSESFSLPLFTRIIFNPALEDVHFVFGLSLYFKN